MSQPALRYLVGARYAYGDNGLVDSIKYSKPPPVAPGEVTVAALLQAPLATGAPMNYDARREHRAVPIAPTSKPPAPRFNDAGHPGPGSTARPWPARSSRPTSRPAPSAAANWSRPPPAWPPSQPPPGGKLGRIDRVIHSRDQDSLIAVQGRLDAPAGRSPAAVPTARAPATALETSSPALQGYRTPEPAPTPGPGPGTAAQSGSGAVLSAGQRRPGGGRPGEV